MRIAMVHDWLVTYAGGERVLEQMLAVFPQADLYSLIDFVPSDQRGFLGNRTVRTSFVQRLPFARTRYRQYLPILPLAIEQFDLSGYDLVISSSHAVAKGVLTGPDQIHLCMCYSPIRYAWDLQHQYLREAGLDRGVRSLLARYFLHRIRLWDVRTAPGVDGFIAISRFISRRIMKAYQRESTVIYPPVDVGYFVPGDRRREEFYLTASRMVPYKRIDVIIKAFANLPGRRLVVIGDGPEMPRLRAMAPANVELLGHQPLPVLRDYLQRARAFLFAAEEDFGIAPLEAQACGTPVIGFARGGLLETVQGLDDAAPTAVFFADQEPGAVRQAISRFEREGHAITAQACRKNAVRFEPERFRREFREYVDARVAEFAASGLRAW
ncbi:MAG TPA: glycosyltransferase family 4 protein [Gemmatimonadales bacterium]|nr:glycosyltransferase family 4 protein [Gemmatimonadales bacterium]